MVVWVQESSIFELKGIYCMYMTSGLLYFREPEGTWTGGSDGTWEAVVHDLWITARETIRTIRTIRQ